MNPISEGEVSRRWHQLDASTCANSCYGNDAIRRTLARLVDMHPRLFTAGGLLTSATSGRSGRSDCHPGMRSPACLWVIKRYSDSTTQLSNRSKSLFPGTFPIDTAKTRLQVQGQTIDKKFADLKYRGMIDCFVKISREEGVKALYSG